MKHLPHADGTYRLSVHFVGSGRDYFRIWALNTLLTTVTLGLFHPLARLRRQRYFHGCTHVGGEVLSFDEDPRQLLTSYLRLLLMFAMGWGLLVPGHHTAWPLLLPVVLLWPAVWFAALKTGLTSVGWRGVRLDFHGTLGGAYAAWGLGLVLAGLAAGLSAWDIARAPDAPVGMPGAPAMAMAMLQGVALLLWPAGLWRLHLYRQAQVGLAAERLRFGAPIAAYYRIGLRAGLLALVAVLVAAVPLFGLLSLLNAWGGGIDGRSVPALVLAAALVGTLNLAVQGLLWWLVPLVVLPLLVLWLPVHCMAGSYATARLQNLTWNSTRSQHLRFESRLSARALRGLSLRNGVLLACTLGLYWPFASVARARLRLEAVTVVSTQPPASLGAPGKGRALATATATTTATTTASAATASAATATATTATPFTVAARKTP